MLLSTVFSSSSAHLLPGSSEPPPALKGRRPQLSLLFPARGQEHRGLSPCPEPQLCRAQQPSRLSCRCGSSPPAPSRPSGATQNGDHHPALQPKTLPQLLQGQNHLEGHWGDRDARVIFLQQVLQVPERQCQSGQGAHESCSTQPRDRHNCHTTAPSLPRFPPRHCRMQQLHSWWT